MGCMKTISFVIPVYRNENALTLTHQKIQTLFQTDLAHYQYEIFFIDDGSDDGSLAEILALREKDKCVKAVTFTRNFGQMAAMLAGFQKATGDVIINVSADLQDPIDLVTQMTHQWEAGSEIVICHRTAREDKLASKLFSRIAYGLLRLSVPQLPAGGFDFVLMDRKVMDTFNSIDVRNRFFQGDLLWSGYRTSFIPYTRMERKIGKSQYNFWKKSKNFIDGFLDASYLPIRAISCAGVLTSLIGFIYAVMVVISWMFNATPFSGYAPLMIVFLLIGGLILTMLGVVGEYVWRIYDEVRKKPNFLIREEFI
jgi:glycosyltransferase involved in cell wall biosynthesis